jgi:hypothetical protein
VTGRRERRRRNLLDNLKERRGTSHLKEEALDHTMWRTGFEPIVRQNNRKGVIKRSNTTIDVIKLFIDYNCFGPL